MSEKFVFDGMTPDLQAYLDHRAMLSALPYEERAEHEDETDRLTRALPEGLLELYHRKRREWVCRDATANGAPKIHRSGSGRYELHVTSHGTGWSYSKGRVYRDGELIAEVCRNLGIFPFLFIEGHPNGNDYLICGEDYQGQVVIELNTGRQRTFLPEEARRGHGFCWASYRYDAESRIVVVDGCFWACPYEFRFFDFSDPMEQGWPELQMEGSYAESGAKQPEIDGDTIRTFESEDDDPTRFTSIKTWKREGLKLVLQDEWVSEAERARRKEQKEAEERWEAWKADFKANDPLHLAYKTRVGSDAWLKLSGYESWGTTHDNWCPDFTERETRLCQRIVSRRKGYTVDLEWAVKSGPIKLVIFKDGETLGSEFFPHSVAGMNAAFDYVKGLLE